MQDDVMLTALTVARSAEQLSYWEPGDWPQLAVELLLAGFDDAEIAELAGLPTSITGWGPPGHVPPLPWATRQALEVQP